METIIAQTGQDFLKDQTLMEDLLERNSQLQQSNAELRAEVDRLNNEALENSIRFRKEEMKSQTASLHLKKLLDEIEAAFDSDEKFESPEICSDYLDAAIFAQNFFGRTNNRVRQAQEWYNSYLPY